MGAPSQITSERIVPGLRIGSYQIERALGAGGMGTVYAARHVGLDKPVVIKTLHTALASREESVRRFVREGRAASKIRHPHVVDVTDVGTYEGLPYLVMEYLEGEDLHARLNACGRLTPPEIARVMVPILDALAYAHEAGVIHRDLKPSNIFLARGPHGEVPMILDFGIAKIMDTGKLDAQTITVQASYLGTPYYSSPEQAKSGRNADARSDQFSVGAIMYELVTGDHGLPGETPFEVLSAIVARKRAKITLIGGPIDPTLVSIIERAMTYEAEGRFPSIRHLGHALLPLAPADIQQRWGPAFHVGSGADAGAGFAETMNSLPEVEPRPEPSGPARAPAFTPPASMPGVKSQPPPAPISHVARKSVPAAAHSQPGPSPSFSPAASVAPPPEPEPPRRMGAVIAFAAFAGLVVAGGIAGGLWYSQTQGAASETAEVTLRATPATATFELDGEALDGAGDVTLTLAADGIEHTVQVRAAGYEPREVRFLADAPPEPIALQPAAAGDLGVGGALEQVGGTTNDPPGETDAPPPDDSPPDAPSDDGPADGPAETSTEDPPDEADAPRGGRSGAWWNQGGGTQPRTGTSRPHTGARRSTTPIAPIRGGAPRTGTPRRGSGGRLGTNNAPVQY